MDTKVVIDSVLSVSESKKEKILDEVLEVEKSAWPPELQASREKFSSRMNIFPNGFFVARVDGKIKGVSTSQVTHYPSSSRTWNEITDNGFLKHTHRLNENALYVVSIGVDKNTQGMGLGGMLLEAQKKLAIDRNLKYLFLGARIPGYDTYCKTHTEIPVEKYLLVKNEKNECIDPEIRFYERKGLRAKKIISNFEPDTGSRDYGVIMVWENA